MPTLLDYLYVAYFALVGPVIDYVFSWPAFRRRSQADPVRARNRAWAWTIFSTWPLVGIGAAIWVWNDRPWASLGFSLPEGWRLWTSIALALLLAAYQLYGAAAVAGNADAQASVRRQFSGDIAALMPHTRRELCWFGGVSLTAGFCEEFLFRGYFIWVLAPWLGWWGAAALSLLIFASAHAYQGWNGVLRVGIVGGVYTLVVATCGSLWPAIAMHAITDLGAGVMAWLVLREGQSTGAAREADKPAA